MFVQILHLCFVLLKYCASFLVLSCLGVYIFFHYEACSFFCLLIFSSVPRHNFTDLACSRKPYDPASRINIGLVFYESYHPGGAQFQCNQLYCTGCLWFCVDWYAGGPVSFRWVQDAIFQKRERCCCTELG